MKFKSLPGSSGLLCLLCLLMALPVQAVKVWTNSISGFWQDRTNWLEQSIPNATSSVLITNDSSKTVIINELTSNTNMTIQQLTLNAPPGATNSLLLSDAGATNPLIIQLGLMLNDGADLHLTNSAMLLQLTFDHVNLDGSLTLDSGSIIFGDNTVTTRVGRATSGVLTQNSGLVSAGTMTVGGLTNSSGTVYLNGGQLNISSLFSVGRNPGTTGSVWITGGQLVVTNDDTKVGDGGVGQLTISNATAILTNLAVGHDTFSLGTLTVQNGASILLSNDLEVAVSIQSTGTLFVAGGQIIAGAGKLKIASQGSGQFNLTDGVVQASELWVAADSTNTATGNLVMTGGVLNLASNLLVGSASNSAGQAAIGGGNATVTNAAATGLLNIANGSFALNGGTVTTDNLVLTNTSGQFVFNGGNLHTRASTVANGAPFVVGNGTAPAVLYLDGGTHVFSGGLVISSNATLSGCGTIIGAIINRGTIATNCSPLLAPRITSVTRTGQVCSVLFTGVAGQTYTLEYKNALTDPTWTTLSGSTNGTTLLELKDTAATTPSRFYQLRSY